MKRSLTILTVIASAICSLSSCRTINSPNSGGNTPDQISATVNGIPWSPTLPFSSLNHMSFGGDSNLTGMEIVFTSEIDDTGNYALGYSDPADAYYSVGSTYYDAVYGSTHVTVFSPTHLVGTFNFVGKDPNGDSMVVTNGQFNVSF